MIPALAVAFVVAAGAVLVGANRLGRGLFAVALAPFGAAAIVLAAVAGRVHDGEQIVARWRWVSELSLGFSFRVDGFGFVMAVLIVGIGVAVLCYAAGYFPDDRDVQRTARFAAVTTLFGGAMLGLVLAGDVWTLFVFWELTSVTSFLLIGLDDQEATARTAAQRALLVTATGGLAMLGGFVCLVHEAGTSDLAELFEHPPTSTMAQVGLVLVLVGAFSKSAQVPLHFWLPGAMAAPTPVSAYLHSATMVKAGVVVVARFTPAFAQLGWWRPLLVCVGGATLLVGGAAALRRDDAKQSLAFGTVSQLGLLVVVFGFGTPAATAAGVAYLVAHALFKSGLFLAIGAVDHATGSRDLRRLSGVGRALPVLACGSALCLLSMIGVIPTLGFAAKESVLAAFTEGDGGWSSVALVLLVVGSTLTVAYSVRLWWGLFMSKPAVDPPVHVHHRPGPLLVVPTCVLGLLSLALGLAAGWTQDRLTVAASALDEHAHSHLVVWPGLHLPLALSMLILVVGGAVGVTVIRRSLPAAPPATLGERAYSRTFNGLLDGARRVTLVTQSGSLPIYLTVVFGVVALSLGVALARGAGSDGQSPVLADSALQAAVALLAVVVAVAVVLARRRFVAVLLLGGVGQCLTVLFMAYGAPDLALTQFMVETLSIVAFVLVLRHFPREFTPAPSWAPRWVRIGLSVLVGVTVAGFGLAAGSVDRPTDVTDAVNSMSLPEAGGKNVVNVVIVDFRGIDTMGEITVFGIAALGVANLIGASRRTVGFGRSDRAARIGVPSLILDQVVRMIFHATLLVSLYVSLRGHNAPGGGFAGGLIAGCAFVFRVLAGGAPDPSKRTSRITPTVLIAVGILFAVGTGLAGLIGGNQFMESSIFHIDVPFVGDVKLVSSAAFDLGVYLLVIGVVILVLGSLSSRTHSGGALPGDGVTT